MRQPVREHANIAKGTPASPLSIGVGAVVLARVRISVWCADKRRCAYERERERVANYLELPNNSITFLQGKSFFPALCISLYDIRNVVVNYDVKSAILSEFRIVWLQS